MKTLIIVDCQYDFMPATEEGYAKEMGGALAVNDGDKIIPIINELLPQFELIIFTKDWHPEDMEAFAGNHEGKAPFDTYINKNGVEDILWPAHCVANTPGARLHEDINFDLIKGDFYIFKKGLEKNYHPYSGFGGTDLAEFLRSRNVHQVFICGLATDFCAKDTAIDSINEGFETFFIVNATKPINTDMTETIKELHLHKIKMIDSWQLPLTFLTEN
jgi:nicotinamidase/pyrazinamidase